MSVDAYQIITDRIVARLEAGVVPWRKPWKGSASWPRNLSGRQYRGINIWILLAEGRNDPRWMTFAQAQAQGGMVRKGEKGTPVILWRRIEVEDRDATGKKKVIPLLRYFTVFNAEQIDGLNLPPLEVLPPLGDPIESAEAIVQGYADGPSIAEDGGGRAYYRPSTDSIHLPKRATFTSQADFYSTLFHEMGHSTGHASRLDREGIGGFDHFGSDRYGKEELVAQMTSAFLAGEAGIAQETEENSAAYLASWIATIKGDKKLLVSAGAAAQRATDRILGRIQAEEIPVQQEAVAAA